MTIRSKAEGLRWILDLTDHDPLDARVVILQCSSTDVECIHTHEVLDFCHPFLKPDNEKVA